jgi:hypothetical protein
MATQIEQAPIKTLVFLPPLRHNKLDVTNSSPVFIENNLKKEKQFLAVSVDKFSVLTNQPKDVSSKVRMASYSAKTRSNMEKTFPSATSLNYKWDSNEMPKLKMTKAKKEVPRHVAENNLEKKKRLIFEQKVLIEQKSIEKNLRDMRTFQLLTHSNETIKQLNKNRPNFSWSNELLKPDIWNSIDFRDINLQNDIINHMYSLDNRALRFARRSNTEFFKCKPNSAFENTVKKMPKAEDESQKTINVFFTSI